jgi:hypothetical protein
LLHPPDKNLIANAIKSNPTASHSQAFSLLMSLSPTPGLSVEDRQRRPNRAG